MAASIDLREQTITASVSDLVGEPDQRAIGLGGSGLTRMWIGQELHRRIQQEMVESESGYRPEVPLDAELSIDGWRLRIAGRADGVVYDDGVPVRVDEIKTLHFAVDLHNLYLEERLERYRRQVRLYALALAADRYPMECRLLLVDVVSGEVQAEDVEWDARTHEIVAVGTDSPPGGRGEAPDRTTSAAA